MNYLLNEDQYLQLEQVSALITLLSQLTAAAGGKQLHLNTNAFGGVLHQMEQHLENAIPATARNRSELTGGVVVTLSGITGSGKTTLMHIIAACLQGHGIEVRCEDEGQPVTERYADLQISSARMSQVLIQTTLLSG